MNKIIPAVCRQSCPESFQTGMQVLTAALATIVLIGAILATLSLNGCNLGALSNFFVNHLGAAGGYSLFGGAALLALIHARLWISCTPAQKTVTPLVNSSKFEHHQGVAMMQEAPGYKQFYEAYKALRPYEYISKNLGSFILAYSSDAGPKIHFFKTEDARDTQIAVLVATGHKNKDFVDRKLTDYFLLVLAQTVPAGSHRSADLKVLNSTIYALYYKLEGATKTTFSWFRSPEERHQFIGSLPLNCRSF